MGLAYLGSVASSVSTGNSASLTVTRAVPAGALLTVAGSSNNGNMVPTVTDQRGNAYTTTLTPNSGAPVVIGYLASTVVTTDLQVGDVITVALVASVSKQAHVADAWTGLATNPSDKLVTAAGASGPPSPGATGTLAQADEMLFVAVATNQLAGGITTLPGYSAASQAGTSSGTNDRRISTFWKESSSTSSSTPVVSSLNSDGTTPTNSTWSAGLMTFKVAATAPPAGKQAYVWDGAAWVAKTAYVWDGNSWVAKSNFTVY